MNTEKNNQANEDEIIDLEAYTRSDKKVPAGKKYKVKVDGKDYVFDNSTVTGEEILLKAGKTPVECHSLYLKLKGSDFELVRMHDHVNLAQGGVEHFITKPPIVYHYLVDTDQETTEEKELTPNQILERADFKPVSDYYLVQVLQNGDQISYEGKGDVPIKMTCPTMKFSAIFKGETPVS